MFTDKTNTSDNNANSKEQGNNKFKYKITTKTPIGKGAFATVYKAVDKDGNTRAIKCIPLEKIQKYDINKFSWRYFQ